MFGKKQATEHKPMAVSRGAPAHSFSVLGADLSVTGNIAASSDLHIDGTVHGDITCESLVQGESSAINGAIVARSARLSGRIDGSISCSELVILKTARITGDVHYDTLTIEQGAFVDGRLSPQGAKPALASVEDTPLFSDAAE